MLASNQDTAEKRKTKAHHVALTSAALLAIACPGAMATSANVSFAGTVGSVQSGIGLSGDQTITTTMVEFAAVRFELHNPDSTEKNLTLRAFDADFRPVSDIRLATQILLNGGERKQVIAFVPVGQGAKRRLRICAANKTDRHCGKFIAQRLP